MIIMALNCGSSSVKYQLFDWDKKEVVAKGMVERVIIGDSYIVHEVPGRDTYKLEQDCSDHRAAIDLVIRVVTDPVHGALKDVSEISAVGHRVVHGGEKFTCSVKIDDEVLNAVKEVQHLAPLHNPPNIDGIEAALLLMPAIPHVAIFDTAFHQTMAEHAYLYAVPLNGTNSMVCAVTVSTAHPICTSQSGQPCCWASQPASAILSPCISATVFPTAP